MKVQADTVRTQLIIRNWPSESAVGDRTATVDALFAQAGLDTAWVKQTRPQYARDKLAPISIIAFWSFQDRKAAQEIEDRQVLQVP
jgi:hypothetical protein